MQKIATNNVTDNERNLVSSDHKDCNKPVDDDDNEVKLESNFDDYQSDVEMATKKEDNLSIDNGNNSENESSAESSDEGWITPSNIKQMNDKSDSKDAYSSELAIKVACVTTDFAMQVTEFHNQ